MAESPPLSTRLSGLLLRGGLRLADHAYPALLGGLVIALAVGAAVHQTQLWTWFIEDAAISFAYARNWADGEGLVPFPGGERLEGYSNPTWVGLLALFELFGIESFHSSKVMQVVLAVLTVPLTYLLAREASPRPDSGVPLVAAGFLATSTTFAIWGASGLENALFSFVLAAALLRSAVDIRRESFPWAALLWMLLAITRPEAILYAAVAGFQTMLFTLQRGLRPTLSWLGAFFVPFLAYHAIRFDYFAWEFPQTYYGKMTAKHPSVLGWNGRGWRYVRNWSHTLWTGYYLPLYLLGLSGSKGWRFGVTAVLAAALGVRILLPEALPRGPIELGEFQIDLWLKASHFPDGWGDGRASVLAAVLLCMPLIGAGVSRGWQARLLCWGTVGSIGFFAVYSMGDWMKAWRWMSLLQVPLAVLFAAGIGTLAELIETTLLRLERLGLSRDLLDGLLALPVLIAGLAAAALFGEAFAYGRQPLVLVTAAGFALTVPLAAASRAAVAPWGLSSWVLGTLGVLVTLLPNLQHLKAQNGRPETGPYAIKHRVEYVLGVKRDLDLVRPLIDLDVDQGGHLWWGRGELRMHDIAGLVDIPFAQHRFERGFVRPYVFDEVQPDFAHLHGNWERTSRITDFAEWDDRYVEIPGYPAGATQLHIGNHVRRDLFLREDVEPDPDRHLRFANGWELLDLDVPSEPATGRTGWLQVAVRFDRHAPRGGLPIVQVSASREGELGRVWTVPLLFDWLQMKDWRPGETFVAGFPIDLDDVPTGDWDLGITLLDDEGHVLPVLDELPAGAIRPEPTRYLTGEVVFQDALRVVTLDELSRLARADRERAIDHAKRGRCRKAEAAWDLSRWHRTHDERYFAQHEPTVAANLAICWAVRASRQDDPHRALPMLERASGWQHDSETLIELRGPIGEALAREGEAAWEAGDWDAAFRAYRDSVLADPTRSWSRRWAEKARERALHTEPAEGSG